MSAKARKRAAKRKKVSTSDQPWNGDLGTGTAAATAGTIIEPMEGPNRVGRRRREPQSAVWRPSLSNRQWQAAQAIEDAYGRAQSLTSGGDSIGSYRDLRVRVDSSPKPDATVAAQLGAISHLAFVMSAVPSAMRDVIEHLFWHQRSLGSFTQGKAFYNRTADVKVALDLVANRLRY